MRRIACEGVFLAGSGGCVIPFSRWKPVWKEKFLLQVRRVPFLFRHFPVKNQQFHDFHAILLAFLPYNKMTVHASLITRWRAKDNRFTVDTHGPVVYAGSGELLLLSTPSHRNFVICRHDDGLFRPRCAYNHAVLQITKRRYEYNPYRLFVIFHDRKFVIFSDMAGAASAFSDMHQRFHQYFSASSCARMSSHGSEARSSCSAARIASPGS